MTSTFLLFAYRKLGPILASVKLDYEAILMPLIESIVRNHCLVPYTRRYIQRPEFTTSRPTEKETPSIQR